MWKRLRSFFRLLTFRSEFEEGMTEEMRFHMEQYANDLMQSGIASEEAARRAQLEFGGVNRMKEECREARMLTLLDELGRELRYAFRSLCKTPGFTLTAILTLGLCLGSNLAILAVIDSILLRPLPFPAAERLVTLFNTYPKAGVERDGASLTNYYERRGRISTFSSLSIYRYSTAVVGDPGSTLREHTTEVSPDFFQTLATGPAVGRSFTDEETIYPAGNEVILTDSYWRQHFNADPNALGKQIRVNGYPNTVVGILPPGFRFLSSDSQLFFPLASRLEDRSPRRRHSGGNVIQMIARLKPGISVAQAQSQVDSQNAALEADDPQAKMMAAAGFRSIVRPLHADQVTAVRPMLLLLEAGVLLLFLIGAVNLMNLLLVRASGRAKEVAIRQAIGANRSYLIREILVENTLLALAGGLFGLAIGAVGVHLLNALGADRLPLGGSIAFDARLAVIGLIAALASGIVLSVPIIWQSLHSKPGAALQAETRGGTAGLAAQTLRHSFIVAQIALAFVLLTGAGLLGLSLQKVMAVSPGFRSDHVLTGQMSLPSKDYRDASARLAFIDKLMAKLDHQPGILSAGIVNNVPLSGYSGKSAAVVVGHILRPGESPQGHFSYGVGGDYFRAAGLSLLAGRFLTGADSRRSARVCVVDEDFARYYWPHANPIGQRLFDGSEQGPASQAFTVVGVVGSVKQTGLIDDTAQGAIYYPYVFRTDDTVFVALRTSLPPESLGVALQTMVRQIDSSLPVNDLKTMQARISDSLIVNRSPRAAGWPFLSASHAADRDWHLRRVELRGIAASTRNWNTHGGGRPARTNRHTIPLHGLSLARRRICVGIFGAWLTARGMQMVLYHLPALPWLTLVGVTALMISVCLLACLIPARRAARISPLQALA